MASKPVPVAQERATTHPAHGEYLVVAPRGAGIAGLTFSARTDFHNAIIDQDRHDTDADLLVSVEGATRDPTGGAALAARTGSALV